MKQIEDKIQFDDRDEIENVLTALEQWQEEHKNEQNGTVKKLISLLDYMHMCW